MQTITAPIAAIHGINCSKVLLDFAHTHKRALVTKAEKEKIAFAMAEVDRLWSHAAPYAVGSALNEFKKAKQAYTTDPTDANFQDFKRLEIDWIKIDRENQLKRTHIGRVITAKATAMLKPLLPPILRRAGNVLLWIAQEEEKGERERCQRYETPWTKSGIICNLDYHAGEMFKWADAIGLAGWTANCRPDQIFDCAWLPRALDTSGPLFNWTPPPPPPKPAVNPPPCPVVALTRGKGMPIGLAKALVGVKAAPGATAA